MLFATLVVYQFENQLGISENNWVNTAESSLSVPLFVLFSPHFQKSFSSFVSNSKRIWKDAYIYC